MRCCRGSSAAAAARAACACAIPALAAAIRSTCAWPTRVRRHCRCQEVRALAIAAEIERVMLAALAPDRIALAVAALGEIEQEAHLLERQWSLKREGARYEAERARRQYDADEPENRLVARSLERVWEERLRRVDQIEQEYDAWRREQAA